MLRVVYERWRAAAVAATTAATACAAAAVAAARAADVRRAAAASPLHLLCAAPGVTDGVLCEVTERDRVHARE